jgi:hypothetical protein
MPFERGNKLAKGRPDKGASIRELVRNHPVRDKRQLVATAYRLAIAGDPRWAEWLMRHGVDGFYAPQQATTGSTIREIIIRETTTAGTLSSGEEPRNQLEDSFDVGPIDGPAARSAPHISRELEGNQQ